MPCNPAVKKVSWWSFWWWDGLNKKRPTRKACSCNSHNFVCLFDLFVYFHASSSKEQQFWCTSKQTVKEHFYSQFRNPFQIVGHILAGNRSYWQWINVPRGSASEVVDLSWKYIILVLSVMLLFIIGMWNWLCCALHKHRTCSVCPWTSRSRWWTYIENRENNKGKEGENFSSPASKQMLYWVA